MSGNQVISPKMQRTLQPPTKLLEEYPGGNLLFFPRFQNVLQVALENLFFSLWPKVHISPTDPLGYKKEIVVLITMILCKYHLPGVTKRVDSLLKLHWGRQILSVVLLEPYVICSIKPSPTLIVGNPKPANDFGSLPGVEELRGGGLISGGLRRGVGLSSEGLRGVKFVLRGVWGRMQRVGWVIGVLGVGGCGRRGQRGGLIPSIPTEL